MTPKNYKKTKQYYPHERKYPFHPLAAAISAIPDYRLGKKISKRNGSQIAYNRCQ
jgi:hypothetical protein